MPANWIDTSPLPFNTLLLLERVQLSWLPGWLPEAELAVALQANPAVEWYMRHKCPELSEWLDGVLDRPEKNRPCDPDRIRHAELAVLNTINDLVTYAVDPAVYDAQPFLNWEAAELTALIDLAGKTVIDVGSGTGRLALIAAPQAKAVFAVEPVGNLRRYLRQKAREQGFANVFPVDGLFTDLPFPDHFADVTMAGHVFGDSPEEEYRELARVTRRGGLVILCPGDADRDSAVHHYLVSQGFQWSCFEEPGEGLMRKYWKGI